ncbi:MAG: M12 family metallo-peptidase [Gemmatimonadota bacterium]|nr:M12 family metallo-peptidase [Gemmatimonadota bacterium]
MTLDSPVGSVLVAPGLVRWAPRPRWFRPAGLVAVALLAACGGDSKSPSGPTGGAHLSFTIAGLPTGASARVSVSGPGGYTAQVTGSRTIGGLAAGTYAIGAQYVNAQSQTWSASVSAGSVTVATGDTAAVTVTYTGGPPPSTDLRVSGVQLIQSTQRTDGTIPMIAGRDALLRVFVTANTANTLTPAIRVRLYQGATQVDSLDVTSPGASTPTVVDTANLATSWNVVVPGARVAAGMAYRVEVDPGDQLAETDEGNNRFPGGVTTSAVTVQTVPALGITFVPVRQSANNTTGAVSGANKDALAETTKRMMPLGVVNVAVHATYTTSAPVLDANDNNGGWGQILSEMYALRSADGSGDEYVGIVPTTYGGGIAGLGYIGAPASVSWDKASSAPGVIAHELGHNFGRNHAPCGGPSGPDPAYPYANASIGAWGLDLPALQLKSPGNFVDLMSYCNPDWISDYNYSAILSYRGPGPVVASASTPARPGLLVWGRIRDGIVTLEPSFTVTAPVQLPARPGSNRIEGFTAAGRRVFSLSFDAESVADLPRGGEQHFAFVLPLDDVERASLSRVQLTARGLTALRSRPAAIRAPAAAPSSRRLASGVVELRWDAAYPMALVRDAATGEILSFARGGVAQVTAPRGGVRLDLSSGVASLPGVTLGVP